MSIDRSLFLLLGFFLICTVASGKVTRVERGQIKSLMHTFQAEIAKLRPYVTSEAAFADPKARVEIAASLNTLEKQASRSAPDGISSNPGFRITFDLMAQHLRQTKKVFDAGKYQAARIRLNATPNFCMSCHTQTPEKSDGILGAWGKTELKEVTAGNAEYLFITRRFDEALKQMDELIRKFPKSNLKPDQFMDVYRRKLAIFARVKRDPAAAIVNFKKDLENADIPQDVRRNVEGWTSYFESWKSEKEDPSRLSTEKLVAYVSKSLPEEKFRKIAPADPDVVAYLRLSGLLYERLLNENDSPHVQEILYYLAGIERQLSPLYWYSLSESYLRECITKYAKKPYTKKCYDVLESDLRNRYSEQGKTEDDVQTQLDRLKEYL